MNQSILSQRLWVALVAAIGGLALAGCGSSHSPDAGTDGGTVIEFDAMIPDAGPPTSCGNGRIEAGEICDDGNTTPGDGCDATCQREPYCGDGSVGAGEVCDDGNNNSGDGCRSDCLSDESCGNGIIDFAAGEICDGGPSCSADCMSVPSCGDGMIDPGEECDDGNTDRWDGCDSACREELSLIMSSLEMLGRGEGCDYTGDGVPDNALGRALSVATSFLNPQIQNAIEGGDLNLLLNMQGLEDRAAVNDDDFRIGWMIGADANGSPSDNLGGDGTFLVNADSLNPDGSPATSVQSRVAATSLDGGPEDLLLPLSFFIPLELQQGRIFGTTSTLRTSGVDTGELHQLQDGLLCGGVPVATFGVLPHPATLFGGSPPPACDGSADGGTMADALIGGFTVMGIPLGGAAPDLDLDGDGLERFILDDTSDDGSECQAVVIACIDGDGTRIDGRNCYNDPRIADGFTAGFAFTAVHASIVGVDGGAMPPPPGP